MLAYLFWHRPYPHVDKASYEKSLIAFHDALSRAAPPGLIAAGSFAIAAVPWLGQRSGYEDWCLIEGSWALDPLNAWAVTGPPQSSHDSVAASMEEGHGGLYRLAWGEPTLPSDSTITWLTRTRGIQWQSALAPIRGAVPNAQAWRRQMVLGPSPEFAIVTPGEQAVAIPDGWQARVVKRARLGTTQPRRG